MDYLLYTHTVGGIVLLLVTQIQQQNGYVLFTS